MRTTPRPRHYVSPAALTVLGPLFALDFGREAYLLRFVGGRVGPVLRPERRRSGSIRYRGPERRARAQASSRRAGGWAPLVVLAGVLAVAGIVVVLLLVGGDGGTARGATQRQTAGRHPSLASSASAAATKRTARSSFASARHVRATARHLRASARHVRSSARHAQSSARHARSSSRHAQSSVRRSHRVVRRHRAAPVRRTRRHSSDRR